jgi:UDP-N-acetylglucosamine 4,6-dehydratase/5-epimerase
MSKKITNLLKNKTVLITGGAGSIGTAITTKLLEFPVKSVRIFDNNEYSLFKLKRTINDPRLKLLLGSILDKERIDMAGQNVDIIIHAAAVKNIEITEFNAIDTIDINVNGTVNMVKMAIKNKPEKFINISTDKVAETSTLYGTTKMLGERVTSWAGIHLLPTKFASIRFGNVIETKGNVFEVWEEEAKNKKPISITHPKMKRYFWHIDEAVDFVINSMIEMKQGEIFVPKMKNYNIKELASKISKKQKIIGLRPGEKFEEILITDVEKENAVERKNMWIIKPKY